MNVCDFDITTDGTNWRHECKRCGDPQFRPMRSDDPPNVIRICRAVPAGVGDSIAKFTAAIGVKPCGGCKKRQALLNGLLPYKKSGAVPGSASLSRQTAIGLGVESPSAARWRVRAVGLYVARGWSEVLRLLRASC